MAGQTILHKLFGWYSSSPINLTKQEVKGKRPSWMDMLGGGGGGSSRSFSDLLRPSDNPVDKQSDMETMMNSDIGRPIIETYAEEASQLDINQQKSVWYECNDSSVEDELNKMLERIGIEDSIHSICYQLSGKGNHFRRVLYNNNEGIVGFVSVHHQEMRRVWDQTSKRLLGFIWQGQQPTEPILDGSEHMFSPWSFIHFRNLLDPDSEYGVSMVEHLYPMFKRMQYGLNQMTMYRLHCMPNRHVFWIDGGTQDFTSIMEQAHMFESMMRQKSMIGNAGMLESRFDPPAMDSMLFIPKRTGEETKYEVMQGDKEVPDVYDLEYLAKCFYGGARIPKAYLGHGDDSGNGLAKASLVSQDIRFARMIRVLRRPVIYGFWQLACIHLALKGKDPTQYNIKVRMSKISALEEEVNAATLESQMRVAADMTRLCKDLEIPNSATMELIFKEYLKVPRNFIDVAKLAMAASSAAGNDTSDSMFGDLGGGMGGGGMDDLDLGMEDGEGGDGLEDIPVEAKRNLRSMLVESVDRIKTAEKSGKEIKIAESLKSLGANLSEIQSIRMSKKSSLTEQIENDVSTLASVSWPIPKPNKVRLDESVSPDASSIVDGNKMLLERVDAFREALSSLKSKTVKKPSNRAVQIVENARREKAKAQQKRKSKKGSKELPDHLK
jgi:hypothetical protein